MAAPTPFHDLNGLLEELVTATRDVLGANFLGAYLQGSFAVGDADEHSDVDFIVVTDDEVTPGQEAGLQAMHGLLFALETPWAQHLEGSYVPKELLRRVDLRRTPFLYLDNGATELIRDPHCNTAVVRVTLREHGLVLAGPAPPTLVDPVRPEDLRAEVLEAVEELVEWAPQPTKAGGMSRWKQPYLVVSFCRMLHTLATGRVSSKREAGEWACEAVDPKWRDLIQRALDDRPDPWGRVYQPAEAADVGQTLAFAQYARDKAAA